MKKRTGRSILFVVLSMMTLSGCGTVGSMPAGTSPSAEPSALQTTAAQAPPLAPSLTATPEAAQVSSGKLDAKAQKTTLLNRYSPLSPSKWGEHVPGVLTHLQTKEKVIALTFDACGGKEGSGYDEKLIDYLVKAHIPATLFMNARWIDANPGTFAKLAADPLFEIENHGTEHRPLSVNGKAAYGIAGTKSVSGVIDEVKDNADKIEKLTGRRPLFYRSGTAYYDEVAVQIVQDLGFQAVNYNVLGDAGATYNTQQVYQALMKAHNGAIVLAHMNQPEKDTAEGVIKAVPELQKAGFRFVQLSAYPLE
ncbi:polysaccharide deacetylase family protein [Paenibacillus sp. GCM10027628]|uniref:polysaccharide deacetylase family protein n=1 Tax=Paenibacillus sp. GCM10027628 TaxID=3273413 RepID=UPI0036372317